MRVGRGGLAISNRKQVLPELLAAYERGGRCFAAVRVRLGGEARSFEFGLTRKPWIALRTVLEMRPFEDMPGVEHRYFFVDSFGMPEVDGGDCRMTVRVVAGDRGRNFDVALPLDLVKNLLWFCRIRSFADAAHLREVAGER